MASEREMSGLTQRPVVDLGFISGPMRPEDNSPLLFHRKHGLIVHRPTYLYIALC